MSNSSAYSTADQPARFAAQQAANNVRALNIDAIYNGGNVKGKNVIVTGGNRGIGLAIAEELVRQEANVIITSRANVELSDKIKVIPGIEVTDDNCGQVLVAGLQAAGVTSVDVLINNAGYFYEPVETLTSLNFKEELKMIDICAVGPLRISSALVNANLLPAGSKIVIISSQGGSIAWRDVQNPTGHDYGHHMSKAAENMMGKLLSQEVKSKGIAVSILHPGFNKTEMTKKYEHIWAIEGAVDSSVGAKRVLHEIGLMSMENTGAFINCEDGLLIPW